MKGWVKFLLIFTLALVFVGAPVVFIVLHTNEKVYTREQAYALASKVCTDLGYDDAHTSAVSDYNEDKVSDEVMNYIKGSANVVRCIRDILSKTNYSENNYFKWIGPKRDYDDEDEDGDTDDMIDWDYYYVKYKFIKNGVTSELLSIKHSPSDGQYKVVITLTESSNGWDFDYWMTDYYINEFANKNELTSRFVYNIKAKAENEKVYSGSYATMGLDSKNLYKDGSIVVGDCSTFVYQSINTKTKKMETISKSETADANRVVSNLVDSAKKLYSVSFENIEPVDLHLPY